MLRFRWLVAIPVVFFLAACQHGPLSTSLPEDELRAVDLDQARAVQAADTSTMAAVLHPDYVAHLPNGRTVDRAQTLALVESGASATERFQRTHERVVIAGATGVVIGVDRLVEPPSLARNGERTRRYTNIYARWDGRWRLLARHFNFLP